jgi:hypothetical protein
MIEQLETHEFERITGSAWSHVFINHRLIPKEAVKI